MRELWYEAMEGEGANREGLRELGKYYKLGRVLVYQALAKQ